MAKKGLAALNAGDNGNLLVQFPGDGAPGTVPEMNPIQFGGVASSVEPAPTSDGEVVVPYFDEVGRLHTINDGVLDKATDSVTTVPTGAANVAPAQVALSTTSGTIAASRATRRSILIRNLDTSIVVYVGIGTVTNANSLPLQPGDAVVLDTTAALNGLAASGTPTVAVVEIYD